MDQEGSGTLNPYAPPAATEVPAQAPAPAGGGYRPLRSLTTAFAVVVAPIALIALVNLVSWALTFPAAQLLVGGEETANGVLDAYGELDGLVRGIQMVTFVASAILFCMIVARGSRNAWSFNLTPMVFSPGVAVGYFFVPFLNLWKPYQVMKELWLASGPSEPSSEVPGLLPAWWAAWIGQGVIGRAWSRSNDRSINIITNAAVIVAAVLAAMVVRQLAERQDRCQKTLAAAPAAD